MVQKVDYFAVLSRAVEQLERDAYAARGAIYDREHKALLKRLISSSAPCSDADIAREEDAFRDAVRRIEFPDNEAQSPRTARREPAEAAWPGAARARARRDLTPEPVIEPERLSARSRRNPQWGSEEGDLAEGAEAGPRDLSRDEGPRRPIGPEIDFQAGGRELAEPDWDGEEEKPRRPFLKVALIYLLVMLVVLGAAALGYAYVMGLLDFRAAVRGEAAIPTEQAFLYEGGQAGGDKPAPGRATWQTRAEPEKSDLIVTLDAEVADPPVALAMTLARVTDSSSGMSHLFELSFRSPAQSPLGGVARVSNIAMRTSQDGTGESLIGTSVNIAPGHFMFGLLGVADVVHDNLQRLRGEGWLDFTLVFGNGATYTLSVEKGASGGRAMSDALASWGQ
jgi:hypothetical protein